MEKRWSLSAKLSGSPTFYLAGFFTDDMASGLLSGLGFRINFGKL